MGKVMKKYIQKRVVILVLGTALMLLSTSIIPNSLGKGNTSQQKIITSMLPISTEKTASFTLYIIGKNGLEKQEIPLLTLDILKIYEKFQELKKEITDNPRSEKTQYIIQEFLDLLAENHALPTELSKDQLISLLQPPIRQPRYIYNNILPLQSKASEFFCNFATTGEGSAFPIIILPRFIPFILTPIPRAFVWWSTPQGITSVGGLISRTGFIAGGQQQGIALGFWGIGFSIFLPPIMSYGIFGYALYTRVTAEVFEFYPPNTPPEITQTDPVDGQQMVPVTTSELRFSIQDTDGDLMSYSVTTDPDIGSGSAGLKPDGVYSIPLSGLESLTTYTCNLQLNDGKDTTEETITFTTEPAAPFISNPLPADDDQDVPMNLPQLQFTLKDYQGDAMEYTVQTSPNIGSDHKIGVHDGTYTVPISGMTYGGLYRWYVNVTDGTHWARKTYSFTTGYPSPFDPFDYGWQYRKQITVDHTQVAGDLESFPVLLSTIDPDLIKAQADGDDLLFMNGAGAAVKLRHEIESFNQVTGSLTVWVNIPALSSAQDTVFYVYYGNPSAVNQAYPQKTWNSHYLSIWHLNETNGIAIDSTGTHNGIPHNGVVQGSSGKIGCAYLFDGVDDYVDAGNIYIQDETTISYWIKTTTTIESGIIGDFTHLTGNGRGFLAGVNVATSNGYPYFRTYNNARDLDLTAPINLIDGQWHFITNTFESSGIGRIFIDGVSAVASTEGHELKASDHKLTFGGDDGTTFTDYSGKIDEIQISNIVLSQEWIETSFINQNDPPGFFSIGPEESGP
jgi:hypothetical protein